MSIKAVSWALEQYVSDPVAKLVLVGIADRYNDEQGYAWPSVAWLAKAASVSDRTVQRKIKLLSDQGFLAADRMTGGTSHYRLMMSGVTTTVGGDNLSGVTNSCQGGGDKCVSPKQYNNNNTNKDKKQKQKVVDWMPDEADRKYADELGLNPDEVLESIRLWDEQNGNKATYASVTAFWKNWCKREAKSFTGGSKRSKVVKHTQEAVKGLTEPQKAFIENLIPKYKRAYPTDDAGMIRDALTEMMEKRLDIEGWYKLGYGLKHHTEF
jgi:hypothetical protein